MARYPGVFGAIRVHFVGAVLDSEHLSVRYREGPSVVAVDGTEPAYAAVRRLLRAVLLTAGLAAAGWLLATVFATGSAAADVALPSDEPALVDGLTDDLSQVLTGSAQTVAGTPTPPPAAEPVSTPPPPPPVMAVAPPGPVATHPHKSAHRTAPAGPAHKPVHPAPLQHRAPDQPHPVTAAAPPTDPAHTGVTDHASHPDPLPDRTPSAPSAPTSSVSAGHDGPGQARGGAGLLAAHAGPAPGTTAFAQLNRTRTAASRTAGLPAMSPD